MTAISMWLSVCVSQRLDSLSTLCDQMSMMSVKAATLHVQWPFLVENLETELIIAFPLTGFVPLDGRPERVRGLLVCLVC